MMDNFRLAIVQRDNWFATRWPKHENKAMAYSANSLETERVDAINMGMSTANRQVLH